MEADVLLKVTAQFVTGEVITEAEALPRNQPVYLLSDWAGEKRLETLCTHTDGSLVSVLIKTVTIYMFLGSCRAVLYQCG